MTAISAMQNWLALEHEAIWLLPVVGARFDELGEILDILLDFHLSCRNTSSAC